jgi:hypothetical protein
MRQMVLGEEDLLSRHPEPLRDERADRQLVQEPGERRLAEPSQGTREHLQRGHQDPLELDEGFLEERDVIHVEGRDPVGCQDVVDGTGRELVVVLLAGKALLLGRRHEDPILEQGGRRVLEEAGDPENVHG